MKEKMKFLDKVKALDIGCARQFFANHLESDKCGLCGFDAWLISGVRHPEGPDVETQLLLHGHELDDAQAIGSCTPLVSLECSRCGHLHTFNKGRIVEWSMDHENGCEEYAGKFANIGLHPDTFTQKYQEQENHLARLKAFLPEAMWPGVYAWRMRTMSPLARAAGNVVLALGGVFYFCLMITTLFLVFQGDPQIQTSLLYLGIGSLLSFAIAGGLVWRQIKRYT